MAGFSFGGLGYSGGARVGRGAASSSDVTGGSVCETSTWLSDSGVECKQTERDKRGGWRRRGGLGLCLSLGLVHGDRRQNGRGSDADCGRCGAGLLSGVRSCGRLLGIGHNSRSLPQADEEDSTHGRESTMESIEIQSFLFRPSSRRRFALAKDTNSANRLQPRHPSLTRRLRRDTIGYWRSPSAVTDEADAIAARATALRFARVARPRMGWGRFLSDRYSSREGQVIEGDEGRVACLVAIKAWVCTQRATATAASNRRGQGEEALIGIAAAVSKGAQGP